MDRHDATPARQILHQVLPLLPDLDVTPAVQVQNEHIRCIQLLLGGKRIPTSRLGTSLIQQRHPVPQEGRMIMRPRPMGLRTRPNENAQRLRSAR